VASGIRCPSCGTVHHLAPPLLLTICSCGEKLRHPGHQESASNSQQHVDLYEVLGIDRSASADDIRAAYRQRARETHPDAGGQPGEFQAVQAAWEVLGDPEQRRRYDKSGTSSTGSNESRSVPDILGVSVVIAVRRLVTSGFAPRLILIPGQHEELADVVIGQQPSPGARHSVGAVVDVAVSGSDAGIIWRGLRRDAQRVGDDLKGAATATATSAVRGTQRFIQWVLRLVAIAIAFAAVISTAIIIGVYRPIAGLTVLFVGTILIMLVLQRTSKTTVSAKRADGERADSEMSVSRRRIRHR